MKIAFFGTPYFAAAQLEHLIQEGFQISVVVTAPDKPAGRGRKINQSAVKEVALKNGLNLLQPTNLKEVDFVDSKIINVSEWQQKSDLALNIK